MRVLILRLTYIPDGTQACIFPNGAINGHTQLLQAQCEAEAFGLHVKINRMEKPIY